MSDTEIEKAQRALRETAKTLDVSDLSLCRAAIVYVRELAFATLGYDAADLGLDEVFDIIADAVDEHPGINPKDPQFAKRKASLHELALRMRTRVSWKECARRVPMSGPISRIEDRIFRRDWSSEIYSPDPMDPRIVSAIKSGFRAWIQGKYGDPDTMEVLELFVSRWDSETELRDAELAFDISVLAVAIEPTDRHS